MRCTVPLLPLQDLVELCGFYVVILVPVCISDSKLLLNFFNSQTDLSELIANWSIASVKTINYLMLPLPAMILTDLLWRIF